MNNLVDENGEPERTETGWKDKLTRRPEITTLFEGDEQETDPFVLGETPNESAGETARRSGLAFSAGVAFFAAVVFMLILGWLADLFLGSSPWGIVGGIVLGAVIGFVQLFRLSSQIFKK